MGIGHCHLSLELNVQLVLWLQGSCLQDLRVALQIRKLFPENVTIIFKPNVGPSCDVITGFLCSGHSGSCPSVGLFCRFLLCVMSSTLDREVAGYGMSLGMGPVNRSRDAQKPGTMFVLNVS